jgi:RimJ/RimL family protein N-acetyltransferase
MADALSSENRSGQESNRPLVNILGEKVALGPLRRELAPLYQKWDTDFSVNRTTTHARPVTLEEETDAYDRYTKDPAHVFFTIYEKETWRPIGKTYLGDITRFTAEFGIVIGEIDCQGKGYGTETTQLVLDYAFTVLGLHNILLTVMEFNLGGIKAYQKAGFKMIGRRRQAKWMNGKLWDVIYMDCLATEFVSPVLSRIFIPDEPRG